MKGKNNKKMLGIIFSTLLITSGCGANGNNAGNDDAGQTGGSNKQLSGNINIDGSSTVYPIIEAVVEEYGMQQAGVKVSAAGNGTGNGFKSLIDEETEIANASREIKDEEKEKLDSKGIKYTEFRLAFDGITVAVNKDNDFVDHLTVDELKKMWIEDGKEKKWSDIRKGWPDETIKFYSPGTESGTFDYFDEVVLEEKPIEDKATLSEDDNILIQGIKGDKNAIGYFGYAYYVENKNDLKAVPIDAGKGPIAPSNETIKDGTYSPLSRPLFTYVNNEAVKRPEVYDFLRFTIENAPALSEDVGYVPLPDEEYDKDMEKLDGLK